MAYDSARIKLPDRLSRFDIAEQWRKFNPVYVGLASSNMRNMLNGDAPIENNAEHIRQFTGLAGRYCDSPNNSARCGYRFSRDSFDCGANHSIFMVVEAPGATLNPSNHSWFSNGTSSGANKPSNWSFSNRLTSLQMQWGHDNGPNGETVRYTEHAGLPNIKNQEPSTVSAQVNGTNLHLGLDGESATQTLRYTPATNTEGEVATWYNAGGSNVSSDIRIYMIVVFQEFIPNDVMDALHKSPQSLFAAPRISRGIVAAAPAVTNLYDEYYKRLLAGGMI